MTNRLVSLTYAMYLANMLLKGRVMQWGVKVGSDW